jgi:hypothetical protein
MFRLKYKITIIASDICGVVARAGLSTAAVAPASPSAGGKTSADASSAQDDAGDNAVVNTRIGASGARSQCSVTSRRDSSTALAPPGARRQVLLLLNSYAEPMAHCLRPASAANRNLIEVEHRNARTEPGWREWLSFAATE